MYQYNYSTSSIVLAVSACSVSVVFSVSAVTSVTTNYFMSSYYVVASVPVMDSHHANQVLRALATYIQCT